MFTRGEPVKVNELSALLSIDIIQVEEGLSELDDKLSDRGIRLMRVDDSAVLTSAPETAEILSSAVLSDIDPEIGTAGMEVLTIVLYISPVTRRQIDYIRGVNSSFVLRGLILKGMVDKKKTKFGQGFEYSPTPDMLAFFGISCLEDLGGYEKLRSKFTEVLSSEE